METKRAVRNTLSTFQNLCGFELRRITLSLFFVLLVLPSQLKALYCYRCLAMECPGDANQCEDVRNFIMGHIRSYYHVELFLPPCPALNETLAWRLLHVEEKPCPEQGIAATCTAGRMQIKTFKSDAPVVGKPSLSQPLLISHATILGCANLNLLNALKSATIDNRCDTMKKDGTSPNGLVRHSLELEHCSGSDTVCHQDDFCLSYEQSIVKPFLNHKEGLVRFEYGLIIGIVAFIIVVFAAVIGASLCSFPLNRPSNLPKTTSSIEDPDLVVVRPFQKSEDKLKGKTHSDEAIGLCD